MSTLHSLAYLKLNTEPTFHYHVLTHSGITLVPSAIPQFAVYENTGAVSLVGWSGTTLRDTFSGIYSFSFKITGTLGFEVGKTYNVVASSYLFQRPKFDLVSTFQVVEPTYDNIAVATSANYAADIFCFKSTGNVDRYMVQWRINGTYVTGFTSPYLTVLQQDGTSYFTDKVMTKITGVNAIAYYTAAGAEILSSGERYIAITSGFFEGLPRSYSTIISRDYNP